MKPLLLLFAGIFLFIGCSSHQISFSVPLAKGSWNKLPFFIGIYVPDSLRDYSYEATLSGGLCKGHEFYLNIGKGVVDAFRQGLSSICDSVIILSSPSAEDAGRVSPVKIRYIVSPEIGRITANADFSNNAFSVMIGAKIEQDTKLLVRDIQAQGIEVLSATIHTSGEDNGKGEDCHDGVPYLKKAGDMAMRNLRDSILSRLLSAGIAK